MKQLFLIFLFSASITAFSCTSEENQPELASSPADSALEEKPAGSLGPAITVVRKDNFEEGSIPAEDPAFPENWRTPKACVETALKAISEGDVKTWLRCHHPNPNTDRILDLCLKYQRARLKLSNDVSSENIFKEMFRQIAGEDGKGIATADAGDTRWSKDGSSARLVINYDVPGGKFEYRFLKSPEGWKIEGPCFIPPSKQ